MDQVTKENTRAAVKLLATIMPDRTRLAPHDLTFVEDMAYKINQYGANCQTTGRQLTRLNIISESLTELKQKSDESSLLKDGSEMTTTSEPLP